MNDHNGMDALNGRQKAFVAAYVACFNATQAAIAAGYSPKAAHVQGCRLLRNAKVRAAIDALMHESGITKEAVIRKLAQVFFGADMADFEPFLLGEKTLEELQAAGVDTHLVKSAHIRATPDGEYRRIELHDVLSAGRELGRLLGYVINKLQHAPDRTWLDELRAMDDAQLVRLARTCGPIDGSTGHSDEELKS